MPYECWEDVQGIAQIHRWCRLSDVIIYLHQVIRFILIRPLDEITAPPRLKYFDRLMIDSKYERFPEEEVVLNYEYGEWRKTIDLMQLSISVMCNSGRLKRDYPDYKTIGEAENYALDKAHKALHQIFEECWDQGDFEYQSFLFWEDEEKEDKKKKQRQNKNKQKEDEQNEGSTQDNEES